MPTAGEWDEAWKEAQMRLPHKANKVSTDKWCDYWDHTAEAYASQTDADSDLGNEIIGHLEAEGVLRRSDRGLDIGCGPGTYAFRMAEIASEVVCLDSSPGMLDIVRARYTRKNVGNIVPLQQDWSVFSATERYDLVFSAFCPAINDLASLRKMEELSSRWCCLVTIGGAGREHLEYELWDLLRENDYGDYGYDVRFPWNGLYEQGRRPNLRFFETASEAKAKGEEMVAQYQKYFDMFMDLSEGQKETIKRHIMSRTRDGIFEASRTYQIAVLYWTVPGDGGAPLSR